MNRNLGISDLMKYLLLILLLLSTVSTAMEKEPSGTPSIEATGMPSDFLEQLQAEPDILVRVRKGMRLLRRAKKESRYPLVLAITELLLGTPQLKAQQEGELLQSRIFAMNAQEQGYHGEAEILEARALKIIDQPMEHKLRVGLLWALGVMNLMEGKYIGAEKVIKKALDILQDDEQSLLRKLLMNYGLAKMQRGDYSGALAAFLEGNDIREKLGLPPHLFELQNIAVMYANLSDWDRAIEYSEKALKLAVPGSREYVDIQVNLSLPYARKGNLDKSLELLRRAYVDMQKLDNYYRPGITASLGNILIEKGFYTEARKKLEEAERKAADMGFFDDLALARRYLGKYYARTGQLDKSAAYYEQSYSLYKEHGDRRLQLELYPEIIEANEKLDNVGRALELLHEYKRLNDETVNAESRERIAGLQANADLARKKHELAASELIRIEQEKSLLILQNEQERQQLERWILISALIAAAVVSLLLYRSMRFREKANRILAEKNREITLLNEELQKLSYEDSLTGINNRRYLNQFISSEGQHLKRLAHDGTESKMVVVLMDLDHFKAINDTYGHQAGDEVLQQFAKLLKKNCRKSDIIASVSSTS